MADEETGAILPRRTIWGNMFYGWIIVATCFLVTMISYGAAYTFGVFLTPLRQTFGSTTAAISGAYSLQLFLYTGVAVLAGWGADKYGAKITTMVGGILLSSGLLLTSQVSTVWQLYVTYGLLGIGTSTAYSPLMTTVSRWFVKQRGLALGISSTGLGVGPLIMAPLASYFISVGDWRLSYLVMGCAGALIIPLAWLLKRSPHDAAIYNASIAPPATKTGDDTPEVSEFSLVEAIRTQAFWLISLMFLMVGIGLQIVIAHVVAYSVLKGIPPMTAAVVLSTITGAGIAGRITMGLVSDRIGRKKTLAISVLAEGVMIVWLMGASSAWMLFLFAIIFGFGYGGHATQFPALTGEVFGLSHMGANLGAVVFFWGLGGAFGATLAGHIFDITGSYTSAFALGATAMLLTAVTTLLLRQPRKEPNRLKLA